MPRGRTVGTGVYRPVENVEMCTLVIFEILKV